MTVRARAASIILLAGLVPWVPAQGQPAASSEAGDVIAFLRPNLTTIDAPWIAHRGDLGGAIAAPLRPEGGTVPYSSCTFTVDGVEVPGRTPPRSLCLLDWTWERLGEVEMSVDFELEDGSHVTTTETIEVRERPRQRQRVIVGRRAAIDPAPPEMDIDHLTAGFGDPSEPPPALGEPPCVLRGRGPERTFPPTVRCTERGNHVLVVSDGETGWSLRIDLAARNRR